MDRAPPLYAIVDRNVPWITSEMADLSTFTSSAATSECVRECVCVCVCVCVSVCVCVYV